MRNRRYKPDPIDGYVLGRLRHAAIGMIIPAGAIMTMVFRDYPTVVEIAVGLPAMAAIPTAIAAAAAGEKYQLIERFWITVGLVAFSGLLLWALHLLIPSLGSSS